MLVSDIRIYPVKGLRGGNSVPEAVVEPWGLAGDRRYMVVDAAHRFLTQRQWPRMATIGATLIPGGLELVAADGDRIALAEPDDGAARVIATVWKSEVRARDVGAEAAAWLSAKLGTACRLVFMDEPASARAVDPDFSDPDDRVSFADGFPLLVTTTASLADLNARLSVSIGMDRFRTNVAVAGAEPWAEDGWARLHIGALPFVGTKDCARCAVTTVDQETGERSDDTEPLRTLARFRRKGGGRIIFGQNLIPRGLGRIAVGDAVRTGD